jgi:CheY-like chemotaxis protein
MKSVLLVDDDNTVQLTIGVRLKAMGYTVYTAKDAAMAVFVARQNSPQVIVLDISMPAGDGFLVAERLKNLVNCAAAPIIFITSSMREEYRERALKLGAVSFINKPFDATQLANAIESATSPDHHWEDNFQMAGQKGKPA